MEGTQRVARGEGRWGSIPQPSGSIVSEMRVQVVELGEGRRHGGWVGCRSRPQWVWSTPKLRPTDLPLLFKITRDRHLHLNSNVVFYNQPGIKRILECIQALQWGYCLRTLFLSLQILLGSDKSLQEFTHQDPKLNITPTLNIFVLKCTTFVNVLSDIRQKLNIFYPLMIQFQFVKRSYCGPLWTKIKNRSTWK